MSFFSFFNLLCFNIFHILVCTPLQSHNGMWGCMLGIIKLILLSIKTHAENKDS